jgi:3-methyladenine DNA glycosylase AlkD
MERIMDPQTKLILKLLSSNANPKNVEGMKRFGIVSKNVLGLTTPFIKSIAKRYKGEHELALDLWNSGIYEARILAAFIADPKQLNRSLMNRWAHDFDNWAVCDGVCMHCFRNSQYAHEMAVVWIKRKKEFVKRAGFTMMATLAVHDKTASDAVFIKYLAIIKRSSNDDRNGVKKAVNWALRQIGKRNIKLNAAAVKTANEIRKIDSPAARWIAADALRELNDSIVLNRLKRTKPHL